MFRQYCAGRFASRNLAVACSLSNSVIRAIIGGTPRGKRLRSIACETFLRTNFPQGPLPLRYCNSDYAEIVSVEAQA